MLLYVHNNIPSVYISKTNPNETDKKEFVNFFAKLLTSKIDLPIIPIHKTTD